MRRRPSTSRPLTPTFGPTSGVITGVLGITFGALVVVVTIVHGVDAAAWPYIAGGLFAIAVCWALLLRPRVVLGADELVLRNVVSDYRIPYTRISDFLVRTTTVVIADDHKYVGLGVGRGMREMTRTRRVASDPLTRTRGLPPEPEPARRPGASHSAADQLEQHVAERMKDPAPSKGRVRRTPAVPEIVALVVTGAGFVLSLVL